MPDTYSIALEEVAFLKKSGTSSIEDLEPKCVWQHFQDINRIPRASTKEDQIVKYMVSFGKSLKLETVVDSIGNVIIKKPATVGKENHKTVVLQGHLDMVHQKTVDSNFDFEKDGIQMYIDGDWIKARETTLGADNGIGVATIMAILSANNLSHPAIEALFTVDEEVGMTGAMALKKDQLKGEILLNIDSEQDDIITIGCSGGVDVVIDGAYEQQTLTDAYQFIEISINGFTGGHSGADIHFNLGNAIKTTIDFLHYLQSQIDCRVATMDGGGLTNVIPRDCRAIVAIHKNDTIAFQDRIAFFQEKIKKQFATTDPSAVISYQNLAISLPIMQDKDQEKLLSNIDTIPNGVLAMTPGMDDLVQTSNNIAKINLADGSFKIACHTRSSVDAERDAVVEAIKKCFATGIVKAIGPYPGWEPQPQSNLLEISTKCYEELYGVAPMVKSIHAGLECGILSGTFPKMEMISIGPNIFGAHSPEERLQISSLQKFWVFLTRLLEEL